MAAKKKSATPSTPKPKAVIPTGPQTPAAKRSANTQVNPLVTRFASGHARLFNSTRKWLQKRLPTAQELVYEYRDWIVISYSPTDRGYEGVLALRADATGVKLYFNFGTNLTDPAKLLQGTGKQARFIPLESAAIFKKPEVSTLIDQAVAQSPVPFPSDGQGQVIIRSTSASKDKEK